VERAGRASLSPGQRTDSPVDLVRLPIGDGPARFLPRSCGAERHAAGALAREGQQVVRLIDATPIPLSSLHKWAEWNGRTRGLKDACDLRSRGRSASASRNLPRPRSTTWWPGAVSRSSRAPLTSSTRLCRLCLVAASARGRLWFVTRPKSNVPLRAPQRALVSEDDRQTARSKAITWSSSPRSSALRLADRFCAGSYCAVRIGRLLTILSNDLERSAGRRYCRASTQALANRAAVSLAQAASQDPHLSRPFRKRHSPADPGRDDRLFAVAHRRARQPLQAARTALCRLGALPGCSTHRSIADLDKPPPTPQAPSDVQNQLTFACA